MKRDTPAVLMVTERFVGLAQAVAKGRAVPDLPMVILPPDVEQMTEAQLLEVARKALDDAIASIGSPRSS